MNYTLWLPHDRSPSNACEMLNKRNRQLPREKIAHSILFDSKEWWRSGGARVIFKVLRKLLPLVRNEEMLKYTKKGSAQASHVE